MGITPEREETIMSNRANKIILGYAGNNCIITSDDAKRLTHINVAFGQMPLDCSIKTDHLLILQNGKIEEIRSYNPDIKIVLSLVSSDSGTFTHGCATEEGRAKIANACAEVIEKYGFDGVDFDWEYPCVPSNNQDSSPEDKRNFTLMCKAVRERIDAIPDGKHHILSIAAGADLYYCESVELSELNKYLDYICLMTYDLKCGFHALAGHHTQLYSSTGDIFRNSCDQALRLFVQYGFPMEKLLMGAAFYSRKWENIADRNHGLLQISKNGGGYGPNYGELAANYINKNGYIRYWDDEAKAPWLFNGSTFLSYDDPQSLKEKSEYVKREGCGGIFYWSHAGDSTHTLLKTIYDTMNE